MQVLITLLDPAFKPFPVGPLASNKIGWPEQIDEAWVRASSPMGSFNLFDSL